VRELRALGLTDDGKSLVLVDLSRGAEGERFRVSADERLRAALRSGAPRAVTPAETRVESALSPREIQARLRAGATAEEVAKAAGIPVGRVQRYEAPILGERARVVSEARSASAPGPHRNAPGRPLGSLVDDRLQQESVDPETVEWDAKRRPDGTWLVTLAMQVGDPVRATWSWDPQARRVRAADAGASAVLAPMPAPTVGPDSLTALAEATGVAPSDVPHETAEREALAVGDEGRRRGSLPGRGSAGRSSGLVVLAGRGAATPERAAAPNDVASTDAPDERDADVPGGAPVAARVGQPTVQPQARADGIDVLLPGTEPSVPGSGGAHPAGTVRPSRQERFPYESAPDRALGSSTGATEATAASTLPTPAESVGSTAPDLATEVADAPAGTDAPPVPPAVAPAASKQPARAASPRRRSAVPAWDDIMFGARRG
jgi:hypothetical protein